MKNLKTKPDLPSENSDKPYSNFFSWRRKLKNQILSSCLSSSHFEKEYEQLRYVLERTIKYGESDSALIIGFKGVGKTLLLNSALKSFKDTVENDFITVQLNGLVHMDDNLALKEIIGQLHLDELEGDRVAGSFSDNLLFLLHSLKTGDKETSKPVIFILDEFHLFCYHRNQTLLYNLFEAAQASYAPICVVGMTTRIDVTELLEKRVKSRFSHRTILLLPAPTDIERMQLFKSLLCIESESGRRKDKFVQNWNSSVNNLCGNSEVKEVVEKLLFHDISEKSFRSFLLYLVSQLSVSNTTGASLTAEDVLECYENWSQDDKVSILQGLSTLELCLVIAICHQMELYDEVPFNFEMILQRYLNFARQSHSVKIGERSVILKAFERIQALELIIPVSGMAGRSGLKEYQMYNFILRKDQVQKAIQAYPGLQTDVIQWSKSSLD
ncbi:origin recognition complex subunit 4-like [Macrosteles quadrilineatus]|uniref:origin recognition complex subunit 4-like n=1 Tax=Macrosteles quadrilineatus TaxID=74068 RepID=UPI0023E0CFE3|nr:origin recognition complex subunit 4-like [Macrosteles quadrilineatus]XP_054268287.1 origin recognition complex subunit 4-like [Macrosteles quadrilineatus]